MNESRLRMTRATALMANVLLFGILRVGASVVFAQDSSAAQSAASDRDVISPDDVNPDPVPDAVSPEVLPRALNIRGPWSGSITDNVLGAGAISLSVNQRVRQLGGGWAATFPSVQYVGTFKGTSTTKAVKFNLASTHFATGRCQVRIAGLAVSDTEISGTYFWSRFCGKELAGDKGTFDITAVPVTNKP
jgi:hypothetical protein